MRKDDRYDAFYETYANEVHRISGKSADDPRITDLMEQEPLRRAYRDGVDPLALAAHFCHEHGHTERFPTYESYFTAFANELKRFAADTAQLSGWLAKADPARINSSFECGVHPRLAADGYYRFVSQR
ncbi:hypothetical protein [Rhizobium jaguaris]|uniref:Uncharacterized protein n=1 Tax=Rhizobium jaguaris TaxID=1312183 RepID=A0A387FQE8_9HYPH|nr:hypothetical protein [Rhizobium jaguaris]AYG58001.1 hypothetical protein CCGE525_03605 [Rhizobium jaguaris]